jgi:hypothetical protein
MKKQAAKQRAKASVRRKKQTTPAATTVRRKATKAQTTVATEPALPAAEVSDKQSKKDTVINLLQREQGATLAELMTATEWQAHSIRGFISGTVRKKLGLTVERQGATYRVVAGPA